MSQFFTPDQIALLSSRTVRLDFLVELQFTTETVYLHNGEYDLTINGHVWKALHGIGQIEGLSQSGQVVSQQVTMRLAGLPQQDPDILALALEETPQANQQLAKIYIQLFDEDWQPIGSPILVFFGFMQPPRVSRSATDNEDGQVQEISISVENAFYNRGKPAYGRLTDKDQQKRFPGDKFLRFIAMLQNSTFIYPDY